MEENKPQEELASQSEIAPLTLDEIAAGLRGFGIEENEEILTVETKNKKIRLRLSNIPTADEATALLAAEDLKGYAWVQRVKIELLSRAISWIEGTNLRTLRPEQRFVNDPTDGQQRDIQVVLRNLMLGWGQELIGVLWKVLMVHSDRIEKRLQNAFPDSVILTDYEKRFMDQALKEISELTKETIVDTVEQLIDAEPAEETKS